MTLHEYIKRLTPEQRSEYAKRCKISAGYLPILAGKHARPGVDLCQRLCVESGGRVKKYELRPDVWPAPKRRKAES